MDESPIRECTYAIYPEVEVGLSNGRGHTTTALKPCGAYGALPRRAGQGGVPNGWHVSLPASYASGASKLVIPRVDGLPTSK